MFQENTGLIYSVIKRFAGRGTESEDLYQIGSIGLLKAIDYFDVSYDVKFSTYAVPMIVGEIRRFLRDDGMLKVSRSLKENYCKIQKLREVFLERLGREPGLEEISEELSLSVEEVLLSWDADNNVESLYKTVYQGDGTEICLMDKIPEKTNEQEEVLNQLYLEELMRELKEEERMLINLRYFQEKTQMQTAEKLGVSQVQVSRMEKRILKKMRDKGKGQDRLLEK